jgi:hypothetical protein
VLLLVPRGNLNDQLHDLCPLQSYHIAPTYSDFGFWILDFGFPPTHPVTEKGQRRKADEWLLSESALGYPQAEMSFDSKTRQSSPEPEIRDRSSALIIVGSIEILLGIGCALLIPLSLLAVSVTGSLGASGAETRSIGAMMALYGVAAAVFVWIGVGTIRARRWAREVMLSLSWIWLVTGVCSLAVSGWMLPVLLSDLGGGSGYPTGFMSLVLVATVAVLGFLYVVLPGAFILFYRSRHVAETCQKRDPKPQWTDGLSRRLLTLTILWVMLAASVLVMPAYGWVVPFFGFIVKGASGFGIWAVFFGCCLLLAWGTSRSASWAWTGAIGLTILAAVSSLVTFAKVDLVDFVPAMGLSAEQESMFAGVLAIDRWLVVVLWIAVWGSFLAYLLTVRDCFYGADSHE